MPTNILRSRGTKVSAKNMPAKASRGRAGPARVVHVGIGSHVFSATLLGSAAGDRIWAALPLYSVAETWGQAIHFELPIESGRESGAVIKAAVRTLYFWSDEHRVILAFGPTPLSRGGEMRLPVPCNAWAVTDVALTMLTDVTPGEKVSLTRG